MTIFQKVREVLPIPGQTLPVDSGETGHYATIEFAPVPPATTQHRDIPPPVRPLRVRPDTQLQFISEFPGDPGTETVRLWTPRFSRWFLRANHGQWDEHFEQLYDSILISRGVLRVESFHNQSHSDEARTPDNFQRRRRIMTSPVPADLARIRASIRIR